MADERVEAIRAHPLVGRGSCSRLAECVSDQEIADELDDLMITDPAKAVEWALDDEELWLEQGLNQRWGEADDPQLLDYRRFKEARDGKS